jgi:hypothetical protein
MILEIAKYLSLNGAISAFSENILSLLQGHNTRVHISKPYDAFMNMILQKINSEQIASLHLNLTGPCPNTNLDSFTAFTNVVSLTLFNPKDKDHINTYIAYFPKLIGLSLWYDNEVGFLQLNDILTQLRKPIKRFQIHCARAYCTHYGTNYPNQTYRKNLTVEYFLLDIGHFSVPWVHQCLHNERSCFLMTLIDFIGSMHNIRYVRLIAAKDNVNQFLDWDKWKSLLTMCHQFQKVTVETSQSTLSGERLVRKAMTIQTNVHNK